MTEVKVMFKAINFVFFKPIFFSLPEYDSGFASSDIFEFHVLIHWCNMPQSNQEKKTYGSWVIKLISWSAQ